MNKTETLLPRHTRESRGVQLKVGGGGRLSTSYFGFALAPAHLYLALEAQTRMWLKSTAYISESLAEFGWQHVLVSPAHLLGL